MKKEFEILNEQYLIQLDSPAQDGDICDEWSVYDRSSDMSEISNALYTGTKDQCLHYYNGLVETDEQVAV